MTTMLDQVQVLADQLSMRDKARLAAHLNTQLADELAVGRSTHVMDDQLDAMAADPDIQRELRQIEAEFAHTEMDGLDNY